MTGGPGPFPPWKIPFWKKIFFRPRGWNFSKIDPGRLKNSFGIFFWGIFSGIFFLGKFWEKSEPSRAEPSRAEPSRAEPSRAGSLAPLQRKEKSRISRTLGDFPSAGARRAGENRSSLCKANFQFLAGFWPVSGRKSGPGKLKSSSRNRKPGLRARRLLLRREQMCPLLNELQVARASATNGGPLPGSKSRKCIFVKGPRPGEFPG